MGERQILCRDRQLKKEAWFNWRRSARGSSINNGLRWGQGGRRTQTSHRSLGMCSGSGVGCVRGRRETGDTDT